VQSAGKVLSAVSSRLRRGGARSEGDKVSGRKLRRTRLAGSRHGWHATTICVHADRTARIKGGGGGETAIAPTLTILALTGANKD